ncbi:hypothetical protein A7X67_07275 [Clostridium sp. W14A]|uniref:GNAT family N-acetyltransferase n=1 Tax=Caproicibacter fermentans TaxID=2576756 RepID=A0A7G8T7M1_9FIRM|nr:hypothetical protein A7X67_07275 [Clostridium sp. W14A]QNK39612.1 GNAT family N-acetyltransferase [Caproicibacter fermentans]
MARLHRPAKARLSFRGFRGSRCRRLPVRLFHSVLFSKYGAKDPSGSGKKNNMFAREQPETVLGSAALNGIVRGCFQSCFLGYRLDEKNQCRGYMTEAVEAVTGYAFRELGLHRIEANVMPRNKASLRVLEKAGYREEGVARRYLKINGVREDHIHMVRLNEAQP